MPGKKIIVSCAPICFGKYFSAAQDVQNPRSKQQDDSFFRTNNTLPLADPRGARDSFRKPKQVDAPLPSGNSGSATDNILLYSLKESNDEPDCFHLTVSRCGVEGRPPVPVQSVLPRSGLDEQLGCAGVSVRSSIVKGRPSEFILPKKLFLYWKQCKKTILWWTFKINMMLLKSRNSFILMKAEVNSGKSHGGANL